MKAFSVIRRANAVLAYSSGVMVLAIVTLTVLEVVFRRALGSPTTWTFDSARYLVLFSFVLAAAYTLQFEGHIRITFLLERVPKAVLRYLVAFSYVAGMAFASVLTWLSVRQTVAAFKNGWTTQDVSAIPIWWLYAGILLGALMLSLTFLMRFVSVLVEGLPEPERPGPSETTEPTRHVATDVESPQPR